MRDDGEKKERKADRQGPLKNNEARIVMIRASRKTRNDSFGNNKRECV
jgi:hypothetical protein